MRPRPASPGPLWTALPFLLLAACGVQHGQLVDTGDGRVIRLEIRRDFMRAPRLDATLEDGSRLQGNFREVMWTVPMSGGPAAVRNRGTEPDTVYFGSGYLKRDSLVIDFEYWRNKGESAGIGSAVDNRGRRYKLLF